MIPLELKVAESATDAGTHKETVALGTTALITSKEELKD